MKASILPYVGLELGSRLLRLGSSRADVRATVGAPFRSFRKVSGSPTESDAFDAMGLYVYYRASDVCEAIEAARPCEPTLGGIRLIDRPFCEARDVLRQLDPKLETDEEGLISHELGLSINAPGAAEDDRAPVEALMVFERGYWER